MSVILSIWQMIPLIRLEKGYWISSIWQMIPLIRLEKGHWIFGEMSAEVS